MNNSAYSASERPKPITGISLSHLVNALQANQGNKIVPHLVTSSPLSTNQSNPEYFRKGANAVSPSGGTCLYRLKEGRMQKPRRINQRIRSQVQTLPPFTEVLRRQLIADKGSIRKGTLAIIAGGKEFDSLSGTPFTDAALPERRINVDRVSFRKGDLSAWSPYSKCSSGRVEYGESPGLPFTKANSYGRQNPEDTSVIASLKFKKAHIGQYSGPRPSRTALRKAPKRLVASNLIRKDHAGSVLIARIEVKTPFLRRGL